MVVVVCTCIAIDASTIGRAGMAARFYGHDSAGNREYSFHKACEPRGQSFRPVAVVSNLEQCMRLRMAGRRSKPYDPLDPSNAF